jgi:hypothetical protein
LRAGERVGHVGRVGACLDPHAGYGGEQGEWGSDASNSAEQVCMLQSMQQQQRAVATQVRTYDPSPLPLAPSAAESTEHSGACWSDQIPLRSPICALFPTPRPACSAVPCCCRAVLCRAVQVYRYLRVKEGGVQLVRVQYSGYGATDEWATEWVDVTKLRPHGE